MILENIEEFYEGHPILFEIIVLPFELFIGIGLAFWIINLFSWFKQYYKKTNNHDTKEKIYERLL